MSKTKTPRTSERWRVDLRAASGRGRARRDFLGETAFFASGSVFVDDTFGGSAVNDRHGDVLFAGEGFFNFGFDARFGDLVAQGALGVLAKAFLRGG